jgi:HSP20 family protein
MRHKKITSVDMELTHWVSPGSSRPLGNFPAINFFEDDSGFHLVVELAGVSPENIHLTVCDLVLVIRGNRPLPAVEEPEGELRTHCLEIDHGPFCREVTIPDTVDAEAIVANFSHGLLQIHLPKNTKR